MQPWSLDPITTAIWRRSPNYVTGEGEKKAMQLQKDDLMKEESGDEIWVGKRKSKIQSRVSRTKVTCYSNLSMQRSSFRKKFYLATAHILHFQAKSGLATLYAFHNISRLNHKMSPQRSIWDTFKNIHICNKFIFYTRLLYTAGEIDRKGQGCKQLFF